MERSLAIFRSIDTTITPSPSKNQVPLPPSSMTLRERKTASTATSPKASPQAPRRTKGKTSPSATVPTGASTPSGESVDEVVTKIERLDLSKTQSSGEENTTKKMPRVILRVKGPEES